jgi:hypothetical protein
MKKVIKISIVIVFASIFSLSCTGDFETLNVDPNGLTDEQSQADFTNPFSVRLLCRWGYGRTPPTHALARVPALITASAYVTPSLFVKRVMVSKAHVFTALEASRAGVCPCAIGA